MQRHTAQDVDTRNGDLNRFMELFAGIGQHDKLFPKYCKTCGKKYASFRDYVVDTIAKAHCLEDCSDVMGRPYTMMYRHCGCGNTLVLSITDAELPALEEFWHAVATVAEISGRDPKSIVLDFALQCETHFSRFRRRQSGQ